MTTRCGEILGEGGLIARNLPGYEPRRQQIAMAEAVARAFEAGERLVIEAGTGIGKSFAYLVPAIDKICSDGGRVVISTHTIALQEQLVFKDIPFLSSNLPHKFAAELVKGRSNYLGLRRLERASQRQESLFPTAERGQLWAIEEWAYKTEDGSLADIPEQPDRSVWEMVKSERTDCLGRRCPHYKQCFYQRARRRAAEAQLLIVNHALLFSDLAVKQDGASILPPYDYLILDEAHTIEKVAGEHFGLTVSDAQIRFLLAQLYNERTKKGVLAGFPGEPMACLRRAADHLGGFFEELAAWHGEQGGSNGRLRQPPPVENRATPALLELGEVLNGTAKKVEDESVKSELASIGDRCREFAKSIRVLHQAPEDGWVHWLEVEPSRRRQVTLHARPIDVGPALKDALFKKVKSVVLTSATLTTGGNPPFGYVQKRLCLDDARCEVLGSPFNYKEQVRLYVESEMPDPGDNEAFTRAAADAMKKYLLMTEGRAFVLFTSFAMMKRCKELLAGFIAENDLDLLVQGEGMTRTQMLDAFRTGRRCVLFGADTFWAGVDVAGEALSNVIIVRLPFAVPSHPIMEARIEHIRKNGGNPFTEYQVPEAVLKFKQGFGRLIRTRQDRGIVVILDPRVNTKPYGKQFLKALPDCTVVRSQRSPVR